MSAAGRVWRAHGWAAALLLTLPVGCSSDTEGHDPRCHFAGFDEHAASGEGETRTYLVSVLEVGGYASMMDSETVPGFDLDGRVSDEMDAEGCFKLDYTSPSPDAEPGIDNQMGPILLSLGGSVDVNANIAAGITSGGLLLLVSIADLDDPVDDSFVEVELLLAEPPATGLVLDADGRPAPDQVFVGAEPLGTSRCAIVGGRLSAGPFPDLTLPLFFGSEGAQLDHAGTRIRFDLTDDEIHTGVLGASLDRFEAARALEAAAPEDEMLVWIPLGSVLFNIVEGQADIGPRCERISIAWVFEGVPAIRATD